MKNLTEAELFVADGNIWGGISHYMWRPDPLGGIYRLDSEDVVQTLGGLAFYTGMLEAELERNSNPRD